SRWEKKAPRFDRAKIVARVRLLAAVDAFAARENAVAVIEPSRNQEAVLVSWRGHAEGERATRRPSLVMERAEYNRLARLLEHGQTPELELDVKTRFHEDDRRSWNTFAEIPGRDASGEVVMIGAHLDSWHAGTGARDNG